jgi:hypothetical protein
MTATASAIWSAPPPAGIEIKIRTILDLAAEQNKQVDVFFRADDIALVDEPFCRLMQLFRSRQMPLCLAVVPQWLQHENWKDMQQFYPENALWCWHQHGWNHTNHETLGKKSEFGPSRPREDIRRDLVQGRKHLAAVLGNLFCPVFTPPWNRCSLITLEILEELDFPAVSRSKNAKPHYAGALPDLAVNVDLHTRRETDYGEGWNNLLAELTAAAELGRIGLMLHHQRMNDAAFEFLNTLLQMLQSHRGLICKTFREMF